MLASTLMSTYGCFATPFPPLPSFRLLQPDGGSLEPDATPVDYYYMEAAEDQE